MIAMLSENPSFTARVYANQGRYDYAFSSLDFSPHYSSSLMHNPADVQIQVHKMTEQ